MGKIIRYAGSVHKVSSYRDYEYTIDTDARTFSMKYYEDIYSVKGSEWFCCERGKSYGRFQSDIVTILTMCGRVPCAREGFALKQGLELADTIYRLIGGERVVSFSELTSLIDRASGGNTIYSKRGVREAYNHDYADRCIQIGVVSVNPRSRGDFLDIEILWKSSLGRDEIKSLYVNNMATLRELIDEKLKDRYGIPFNVYKLANVGLSTSNIMHMTLEIRQELQVIS